MVSDVQCLILYCQYQVIKDYAYLKRTMRTRSVVWSCKGQIRKLRNVAVPVLYSKYRYNSFLVYLTSLFQLQILLSIE